MSGSPSTASSLDESYEEAADFNKYRLRVTAGCEYDPTTHVNVPVNCPETLTFENDYMVMSIAVRIRGFDGFPDHSPQTCPYFEHPLHKSDQYSIAFSFIPKEDINGDDLVFGNDFDRPIRDRLPPGFKQAMRIVKWWIDPGLDGDPYADKPYLYGTALSSWNYFRVGDRIMYEDGHVAETEVEKHDDKEPFPSLDGTEEDAKIAWKLHNEERFHETVVEEGADGSGKDIRADQGLPGESAARMKYFLTQTNRANFVFEKGRQYQADFGNAYLNFNDFSLKLPGFSIRVIRYVDSKTHELRYVLKNRKTGHVYAVVLFTLLFGERLKDETIRSRSSSLRSAPAPSATTHAEAKQALDAGQARSRASSTRSHDQTSSRPQTPSNATVEAHKAEASDHGESSRNRSRSSSILNNLKHKKDEVKSRSRSSSLFNSSKKDKDKDKEGSVLSHETHSPSSSPASRPTLPSRSSTKTKDSTKTKEETQSDNTASKQVKKDKTSGSDTDSIPSVEDELD